MSRTQTRILPKPVSVPELLAVLLPDGDARQRRELLEDMISVQGSHDAAIASLRPTYDVIKAGTVIGVRPCRRHCSGVTSSASQAPSPPPNTEVKYADVGPFRIFYHSTFPRNIQNSNPFTWSFYIGQRGQGQDSIMPNWSQHGITIRIPDLTGKWADCPVLTILPSTRVRIVYSEDRTQVTREVVFPPDPKETSITVHYL
ncbi:hypothetical protein B0H17DRAFT_1079222 [Mycena rosella]|uniref:Uncharacterized protein n=1 Tax=Mycena rosella TaxID=1033263 RepID=A0AAD7G8K9_MYCRO|nr:hypothetical protein B0H17DRAFT_1079222 [Mycena rosella]